MTTGTAQESERLPALIDRARSRLAEARNSAEVLEARSHAQAALHYARVTKAANETHADCLRMIVRAEIRMADEIDRGQGRGEVPIRGQHTAHVQGADMKALGLDRQRVAEWREVRDAGEQVVETTIRRALDEGRAPTRNEILQAAKDIRSRESESRRVERISNLVEISKGNSPIVTDRRYPIIYADPPWQYENPPLGSSNRSIENHYPTMTIDEICALPVGDIATEGAQLYLWATSPKLAECMRVIEAWGFKYRTCMVWVKDKIGMGYHVRNQHEHLLIAKRGEMPPPPESARPSSVVNAARTEHSAKPVEFYEIIERMYPELPKIELFSRLPREGWAAWGNQANAA